MQLALQKHRHGSRTDCSETEVAPPITAGEELHLAPKKHMAVGKNRR